MLITIHTAHGKRGSNAASNETKKGFVRASEGAAHTV